MSNHHLSHRALAAVTIVPISMLIACASRGAGDTSPAPRRNASDTSSVANRDGRSTEDLFAGRFPGVSVSRAEGGGLQIRIRGGSNTLYGSDEPLFVADETPLPPGSRGIVFLNPNDIEKIEVLKNPADIAVYGMRGGNGVVKITTKRPGRR